MGQVCLGSDTATLKEPEGVEKGEGSSSDLFCVVGFGKSNVFH